MVWDYKTGIRMKNLSIEVKENKDLNNYRCGGLFGKAIKAGEGRVLKSVKVEIEGNKTNIVDLETPIVSSENFFLSGVKPIVFFDKLTEKELPAVAVMGKVEISMVFDVPKGGKHVLEFRDLSNKKMFSRELR